MTEPEIKPRPVDESALAASGLHPVLRRIYAARGVTADSLSLDLPALHMPEALGNIETAVDLLETQLHRQGSILVVGDFDADGATSSALTLLCLRSMGFRQVDYLVPNRFEYGYGLTPEIAGVACSRNPDLLITVDNGISSHEGVALCRQQGVKVLITDHHLPGKTLPAADCILNPNLPACDFPSKALAGVGVVFYLMLALRARLRQTGWFEMEGISEPNLAQYLDIVALGTVADVVPLDRNNRILVKHGLKLIRSGRARPGISALLDVAKRERSLLTASDLGFAAGPRLNAAGRLDDMSLGIECLLCDDESTARLIAEQLDSLNRERRQIEEGMQQEALALLETLQQNDTAEYGLCLYDGAWHQGVIGILASRLKDRFHLPAVIFADAGDGFIKGSARSVPGLHIRDLLEEISTANPGLVTAFGGHAMAAGLSLPVTSFDTFRQCFLEVLAGKMNEEMMARILWTDGELEPDCLNAGFASLLQQAGPWGQHFPEPLFEGVFRVSAQRILADRHLKLRLEMNGAPAVDAIAFNVPEAWLEQEYRRVRLVYRLGLNAWAGRVDAQLLVEHLSPA